MLYRLILAVLFLIAVALTLNERLQERRAQQLAERPIQSAAGAPPAAAIDANARGSAAARPPIPFVPHRVRTHQDVELLQAPEPMARPVEPISRVPPGILAQAVDERNGWYLIDTNLNRGWAPIDAFDEP
jgi:hypothetical protein